MVYVCVKLAFIIFACAGYHIHKLIHTVNFISSQDHHINERPPTTPDYESVEFGHESAVHITNPAYSNDLELDSPGLKTAASLVYDEVGQGTGALQTTQTRSRHGIGDPAHDPTLHVPYYNLPTEPSMSHVLTSPCPISQPSSGAKINVRERYEMQDLSTYDKQTHRNAADSNKLNGSKGGDKLIIPTDPVTGYSTMLRPDKSQSHPSHTPFYESVKVNSICLQLGHADSDEVVGQISNPHTLHHQDSQPQLPTSLTVVPTDPKTGYSTMLRPGKVVPPPGPVPPYDVINMKNTHPSLKESPKVEEESLSTISPIHKLTVQKAAADTRPDSV